MFKRRSLAGSLGIIALLGSLILAGTIGAAPATGTVVAGGLSGPFFIEIGADGALYYYDGGAGNTETLPPPAGAPADTPPLTRGLTGSLVRIAPDGTKATIASKLPSYGGGGVSGIALAGGVLYFLISPGGAEHYGAQPYPNEGFLVRIDPRSGVVAPVADISGYERQNSPQKSTGHPADSNPWGLAAGADGNLYVTDAAANDLLRVTPTTGKIDLVTLFPALPATEANPDRGGRLEADPVPTGIAVAPDGGFFVAHLPGEAGKPAPGSGKVVRVAADGKVSDYATGFTFTSGLAVGPDKLLYVVELVGGFGQQGPTPGRVSRVRANGAKEVVAEGLNTPHGIAFDKAGNMFISTGVVSFGPPPPAPQGMIMRFAGVAAAVAATPTPSPVPTAPPATPTPAPMPGLPNTGAGGATGGATPTLPFVGLAAILGAGLLVRRRLSRAA